MKYQRFIPLALFPLYTFSNIDMNIDESIKTFSTAKIKKESLIQKISFSYGVQYLGPSLSKDYQQGATYNRFNTGQDFKGDDTDATGSNQVYHSFSLGYKIAPAWKLSHSYTFQDELNKNIEYKIYNSDGSVWGKNSREKGLSFNNQRINLFGNNIYGNNYFFLMSNFFYELPTTKTSIDSEMEYGLGIQPVMIVYSSIPYVYHGVKASLQRDYYKRAEYTYKCGSSICSTKYQTLKLGLTGYLGYNISDKLSLHSETSFDWDQKGDQVWTNDFNHNMDDILDVGLKYSVTRNMNLAGKLQYSLSRLNSESSAFLFNLNLFL